MPEISILLPSLRPEAVAQRIQEFAATHPGVDYELVVVSPFPVQDDHVVYIREERRGGVIAALNQAYQKASGKYIVYWSDDATPLPFCLARMMDYMKSHPVPFGGAFRLQNRQGQELEQWSVYGRLYACWGCVSQETLPIVGGLFDPSFRSYWADPDLGMRTWSKGGKVEVCQDAWIQIEHITDEVRTGNWKKYFDQDTETFFNKWHNKFGAGGKKVWTLINQAIPLPKAVDLQRDANLKEKYLVTALVTTYNSERFMRGLLEDLEAQTMADRLEIIIIDSNSTQNEGMIVEEFQKIYNNIVYVRTQLRETTHAAINRAIQMARGKYLTLTCTDDRHRKDAFEIMSAILESRKNIALIYADSAVTAKENETINSASIHGHFCWPEFDQKLLFRGNFIGPHPMWRRDLHDRYGYFNPALVAAGDYEFWLRIVLEEEFFHIPEVLGLYLDSQISVEHGNRKICNLETEWSRKRHWPKHWGPLPEFDNNFFVPLVSSPAEPLTDGSSLPIQKMRKIQAKKDTRPIPSKETGMTRIVALLAAHNEGDVIYHVVRDLIEQGILVYFINHCSTDNTVEVASKWLGKGILHIENFPQDAGYPEENENQYIWSHLLKRKEELGVLLNADWFIHQDADEFRESPWPGLSLSEAIQIVDRWGYNAIDFELFNFRPIDNRFVPGTDVREKLIFYEKGEDFNVKQIKAWKNQSVPVDLVGNGGHDVQFPGRKVFPIKFILRHYPIRSQQHGLRKVFQERKKRFNKEERSIKWHIQYDTVVDEQFNFIYEFSKLNLYDDISARLPLLSAPVHSLLQALKEEKKPFIEGQIRQSLNLYNAGKKEQAIQRLEDLRWSEPKNSELLNDLGALYFAQGEKGKALTYFQAAIELDHQNTSAQKNYADLNWELGDMGEASQAYRYILAQNPQDLEVLIKVGKLCLLMGRYQDASEFNRRVLEIEPENIQAKENINSLLIRNQFILTRKDPSAGISSTRGKENGASSKDTLIQRRIQIASEFKERYEKVEKLIEEGQTEKALKLLEDLLEENPYHSQGHNDLGVLYFHRGDKWRALSHLAQSLHLNPKDVNTMKNYVDVCLDLGLNDQAFTTCRDMEMQNPDDVENLLTQGGVLFRLGQKEEALERFKKVLQKDPGNSIALENIEFLKTNGSFRQTERFFETHFQ